MVGADHGNPSVGAQPRGVVITIAQAGFGLTGYHPLGRYIPQFHLLLQAALDGIGRHHATQDVLWRLQVFPGTFGQLVNVFQEFRALGQ